MAGSAAAQTPAPSVVDPKLEVGQVVSGLAQPIGLAFIDDDEFFVIEKASGQVKLVKDGAVQSTVLDLAVNSASERGLLGIALHSKFRSNPYVYLYWTESTTGADSTALAEVPLLGNHVDRYVWNGTNLTFDRALVRLHAFQADANQPLRGNHNGGVVNLLDGPFGEGVPDDQRAASYVPTTTSRARSCA